MKKLLYVAPHLSTGGLPQYLTKKIELLRDEFEIHLVEWVDCTGGVLVVTRNKIKALVPDERFYTLQENKMELIDIINRVQPDIVHLEEIPEFFMDSDVANAIYKTDRNYAIVETSHDSSYEVSQKRYFPDKFMFVSDWQIQQYRDLNIPKVLVEYPIEYIDRPDRTEALKRLGLNPDKKHVLHIGLFTPRKNQAEFFEYARSLPEVEFHSVGNQAQNFEWYWKPLMENKPANVTWWNERTDVDNFYQAMDLFLFTSRGSNTDKETMPLVIREALSYQIPQLLYNLPVYLNYFDKYAGQISYLEFDDFNANVNKITQHLGLENTIINKEKEAFIISTYPISDSVIQTTKQSIEAIKATGRKVVLTSHIPIPPELSKIADYCVIDNNNVLTKHTYYCNYWANYNDHGVHINLRAFGNDVYHGPTCYMNYYNGTALANNLGFEKIYFLNYDYILKDSSYVDVMSKTLDKHNAYVGKYKAHEGDTIFTYFMGIKPKFFLDVIPNVHTAEQYDNLMDRWGAESNGLENMWYHAFKNQLGVYYEQKEIFESRVETTFDFQDYSRVEYYTVLPTNIPDHFAVYIRITNDHDSRDIELNVSENNELILSDYIKVEGKLDYYKLIKYSSDNEYTIDFDIKDQVSGEHIETKTLTLTPDYIINQLPQNGNFEYKLPFDYKPKVKLMHLVTEPTTNPKETRSVESIFDFCEKTGIKYEQRINAIWRETPPKDTCNRPDDVQDVPGYYKLAPGHYGCYKAHTDAILAEDNKNYDYVLIFEGDVIVESDYKELYDSLIRFSRIAKQQDQDIIGFGNPFNNRNLNGPKVEDIYTNVTPFIPAQSYLVNREKIDTLVDKVHNTKWDAFDMWVCNVAQLKVGTAEKIYTKHLPGFSIIEQEFKGMDENSPEIYAAE